jgi:hypothetical protein
VIRRRVLGTSSLEYLIVVAIVVGVLGATLASIFFLLWGKFNGIRLTIGS